MTDSDDKPASITPEWIWFGEDQSGKPHISFGRWQKHPSQLRYKMAAIQPTEHNHAAAGEAALRAEVEALRADRDRLAADLAVAREALEPFAKAGKLFPEPPGTVDYDQCIYAPAAGREYDLCGEHLRRARAAINRIKEADNG